MIINNTYETVTGSVTNMQTESFKIANNAHMMDILSKKLYTNPELAVCRELVCNAIDAHKAVNSPKKVEVTMPSVYNDFRFIVKDYGTGLSEEDVLNLYTTYGQSTKQGSNDFIGGLGIGSKSPFALTEEFSVVSRYRGTATTYHCYKQKGLPVCTKLSAVKTDEHDGMTITVPFNINSCASFLARATHAFKAMSKELVEVHHDVPVLFFEDLFNKADIQFKHKNLVVYKDKEYATEFNIRMGQVMYNAPMSWVTGSSYNYGPSVFLELPVGSVPIAASRESIEDCEASKEIVTKHLESIFKDYSDQNIKDKYESEHLTYQTYYRVAKALKGSYKFLDVHKQAWDEFAQSKGLSVYKDFKCALALWYGDSNTLKQRSDLRVSEFKKEKDVFIVDDMPNVHTRSVKTLLTCWNRGKKTDKEYFVLYSGTDKQRAVQFAYPHIFMSQLVSFYESQQAQQKRRKKTAKVSKPKADISLMDVRSRCRYEQWSITGEEIPYVILEKWNASEADMEKVETVARTLDVDTYGIHKSSLKYLDTSKFIPLDEYMKKHEEDINDCERRTQRKVCIDAIHRMKEYGDHCHRPVDTVRKSLVNIPAGAFYYMKGYDFSRYAYTPKTYSDRLVLILIKKVLAAIEATDISWFEWDYYASAPKVVQDLVLSQARDNFKRLVTEPVENPSEE